ncbi:uncharacterized protein LOC113512846 [Galleria mellonella]|uniref:Uncharacterized protein LOC113512846 n=1 Tax=Galleria mellonella TaxID=7137 RepID=A0A6J1WMY5_GALME|nr:uncharacterized protein LOC113512846 [Galleria mellonella]
MPPETDMGDETKAKEQKARAELREGFLREMNELSGASCKILTYEQSTLHATFSAWKPDGSDILVHNMQTPASIKMPSALIRTSDILAVQFEKPIQL